MFLSGTRKALSGQIPVHPRTLPPEAEISIGDDLRADTANREESNAFYRGISI
jgi:hypothetical protein